MFYLPQLGAGTSTKILLQRETTFFFFFKKRKTAMSLLGTNGLDSDLDGYLFIILVNSAKVLFLVALASLFVRWLAGKLKKL